MGTVIPRILNYSILAVYYTRLFSVEEYGVLTDLYAYVTFLLIFLTYGMETGFFKFASSNKNKNVYGSILSSLLVTSSLFVIGVLIFKKNIAEILDYTGNIEFITMLGVIVAIDAFSTIPFAKLRLEEKSIRFSILKTANVFVTIICVVTLYEILPALVKRNIIVLSFELKTDVTYVLLSNLIASSVVLLLLLPEILKAKFVINFQLVKEILIYSLPLLVAGLAGTINETLDRVLLKHLLGENYNWQYELGIYGANYKIAVLLLIFVQMFRFAAEPFYFNYYESKDDKEVFARIMRLFIACLFVINMTILLYLKYIKFFIDPKFHEGLKIVPVILTAYMFYGVFFNLSIWYKLKKKTIYGAILTISGAFITIAINVIFVRNYSYVASAFGHVISYFVMMILSYFIGRKYYPINYNLRRIAEYIIVAICIFAIAFFTLRNIPVFGDIFNAILIGIYAIYVLAREELISLKLFKNGN